MVASWVLELDWPTELVRVWYRHAAAPTFLRKQVRMATRYTNLVEGSDPERET
jgi:hypothetical protein